MKREIRASEVREGMEIEWTSQGWYHRGEVATVVRNDHVGVWFQSSDGFEMSVEPNQAITVLSEPQPEEPTAFGACVKVAGERYVRNTPNNGGEWENAWFRLDDRWTNTWEQVCERGPVTVINPDPFANTEPREPRVWKRWADVPEMTPFRANVFAPPYRKAGDRIECRRDGLWVPAFVGEGDLNKYSPFTEVLPGA